MPANPLQTSSTFKTHSKAHCQQLSPGHLELCILTNLVGLYPQQPTHITSDEIADSAMTAGPPNTASPSVFTCLLSGALDEIFPYIGQEQSKWLN